MAQELCYVAGATARVSVMGLQLHIYGAETNAETVEGGARSAVILAEAGRYELEAR